MRTKQELHDKLRAELPEGAACIDDCPYCADPPKAPSKEEDVSEKVYDQETLDTLVADARSKAAEEARTEADKALAAAQAQITEKDAALVTAQARIEELEGDIAKRDEESRLATVAEERALKVAEVTDFSEDQIKERKAGWAAMDDTSFAAMLADFKAVTESAKAQGDKDGKKPITSKFDGTRETAGKSGTDVSKLRELFAVQAS